MYPMITTLADQKGMQFRGDLSETGLKQTMYVSQVYFYCSNDTLSPKASYGKTFWFKDLQELKHSTMQKHVG